MSHTKGMPEKLLGKAPDDLRSEVRRTLDSDRLSSLKTSCAFLAGVAGICALVGGGIIALGQFTPAWFISLSLITAASGPVAYVISELFRLGQHSRLLGELLHSEKYYDVLLETAWAERDNAQTVARQLQTRIDVLMGIRDLLDRGEQLTGRDTTPKRLGDASGDVDGR